MEEKSGGRFEVEILTLFEEEVASDAKCCGEAIKVRTITCVLEMHLTAVHRGEQYIKCNFS